MTGTEKQIKWAEDIKATAINSLTNEINRMESNPLMSANVRIYKLMSAVLNAGFEVQTDASKIIDRRAMFSPAALFSTCDRWAELIRSGRTDISTLAAKNGLKN